VVERVVIYCREAPIGHRRASLRRILGKEANATIEVRYGDDTYGRDGNAVGGMAPIVQRQRRRFRIRWRIHADICAARIRDVQITVAIVREPLWLTQTGDLADQPLVCAGLRENVDGATRGVGVDGSSRTSSLAIESVCRQRKVPERHCERHK